MRSIRSGIGGDRRRNRGIWRLGLGDPSGVLPNRPWMDESEEKLYTLQISPKGL